jgi:quinol monooxygenase YgiN
MYGTVARLKAKPGAVEALRETLDNQQQSADLQAFYVYQTDADPYELYLAVVFESREAYFKNADSPEQHKRYLQIRELLADEPEWHDGEIVLHRQ